MIPGRPGKAADPEGIRFRELIDTELGPTPPAPADRMEWVLRAALSNGPPVVSGMPRRSYLALAVTLISTGLIAVLLFTARAPAGGRPGQETGDAGDAGPVAVTGSPPHTRAPAVRSGPGASARSRPSARPSPARSTPTPAATAATHRHPGSTPRTTPPTPVQTQPVPPTGHPTRTVPRPTATPSAASPTTPAPTPTPTPTPTVPVTSEPADPATADHRATGVALAASVRPT